MDRKEIVNSQDYKAQGIALDWWRHNGYDIRDGVVDIIDAYADGVIYGWNNPNWISVEERLPEEDGQYWCCDDDGGQEELKWKGGHWYGLLDPDPYPIEGITHWMPMLEAPRKED